MGRIETDLPARGAPATAPPWAVDGQAVVADLRTDARVGLRSADAAARLRTIGPNRLDAEPSVPRWRRFAAQFTDPLVVLLLVAVVISLVVWLVDGAVGVPFEAVVIVVILVANAVLGTVQEARAEHAVAALEQMTAASSTVVRDGVERRVPSEELVPGDIVLLAEGDAVGADGRLLEAASLQVAEASLTGESEPVPKQVAPLDGEVALAERADMAFGGTAVTRGRGRLVVTATGMDSEIGHIAGLLGRTEEETTPLQREVRALGRTLGAAVLVIAVVVVGAIVATSGVEDSSELVDVLLVGVSLAVAAVPEGLPAILSVVLALGVQRMARQHAIVTKLSSVETLGSAGVICSDKTGTLTRNEMTVRHIATRSGVVELTGSGYVPDGELLVDGAPLDAAGPLAEEVRAVLLGARLASDARLHEADGAWDVVGDPTEVALLVAGRKAGLGDELDGPFERIAEVPFTSERKLMSTVQLDRRDGTIGLVTKGAPDVLLSRCTHERAGAGDVLLSAERRTELLAVVDALAREALRPLAVAHRAVPELLDEAGEDLEQALVLDGVVGLIDPARAEAGVAVADAHAAGIRVIMITGDHPATAARIAADLGIAEPGAAVLTGIEIGHLDDDALRAAMRDVSVCARVSPEHKLRIIDALQADGLVVAMTGDGVNDAPALKAADIGIAMGITGTDVTKAAARMVLADDNFATIVAAVREGRAILANIRTFLRYLLSSNVGEVLTMFFGVLLAGVIGLDAEGSIAVPLLATQILWINLLTDAAPALAMGLDPPPGDLMDRPPRRVDEPVVDREMWSGVLFIGAVMAAVTLLAIDLGLPGGLLEGDLDLTTARTMGFTTLVLAQLFNCFNARSDRASARHRAFANRALVAAIALSLALQVAVVHLPLMNDAFDTAPLSLADWLRCTALASVVLWASEARKLVVRAWARRGRGREAPGAGGARTEAR